MGTGAKDGAPDMARDTGSLKLGARSGLERLPLLLLSILLLRELLPFKGAPVKAADAARVVWGPFTGSAKGFLLTPRCAAPKREGAEGQVFPSGSQDFWKTWAESVVAEVALRGICEEHCRAPLLCGVPTVEEGPEARKNPAATT